MARRWCYPLRVPTKEGLRKCPPTFVTVTNQSDQGNVDTYLKYLLKYCPSVLFVFCLFYLVKVRLKWQPRILTTCDGRTNTFHTSMAVPRVRQFYTLPLGPLPNQCQEKTAYFWVTVKITTETHLTTFTQINVFISQAKQTDKKKLKQSFMNLATRLTRTLCIWRGRSEKCVTATIACSFHFP